MPASILLASKLDILLHYTALLFITNYHHMITRNKQFVRHKCLFIEFKQPASAIMNKSTRKWALFIFI